MEADNLTAMLNELTADPAKMAQIGALIKGFGGSARTETSQEGAEGNTSPSPLGALLSNPELLAQLPAMMESLRPMLGQMMQASASPEENQNDEPAASQPAESAATDGSVENPLPRQDTPPNHPRHSHTEAKQRAALLLALKPYLNSSRCEMIDYIVNLSKLGEMLRPRDH